MTAIYVSHETGEIFETKNEAMEALRNGIQIDLYGWSETLHELIIRGYWEP